MAPMAAAKKTLYEILGVPRDANDIDIGLAHEKRNFELARDVPPDPSAKSLVHEAFEVLSNPKRRAAYDASLVSAAEKAAASQQSEPDLVLESDEEEEEQQRRKKLLIPVAAVAVVVLIAMFFLLRSPKPPAPPPVEPVAEAPNPPPPAPPKPKSAPEILADAVTSGGKVLSYEMSGRAVPVGLALSTEPGMMVTTCHGLPAGSKLVVSVGGESLPADLAITDEDLDLCKLAVAGFTTRPLSLAADEAKAGDKVYTLGMNSKGELALTEGTVKQVLTLPVGKILDLSMPIAPAGSGAPVFNEFGRVVGIATTPHKFGPALNVALPISWVSQMRSRGPAQ
jgi:serine protease Do